MNNKALVRLSNVIGIASIILLVYWVFIFISITVFGLKVFKENLTQSFYLSVVGILALMIGSLIINVMFNLTRIAEKHNVDDLKSETSKRLSIVFVLSFPTILAALFFGDFLTSSNKEKMLILSAKSIVENDIEKSDKILNYSFDREWITKTSEILEIYSGTDKNFPNVNVMVLDSIDKSNVFLGFSDYKSILITDTLLPLKQDYIVKTTNEEREYLYSVFKGNNSNVKFSAKDGSYELFYPYIKNKKKIVLHFSDYQRYGKLGK